MSSRDDDLKQKEATTNTGSVPPNQAVSNLSKNNGSSPNNGSLTKNNANLTKNNANLTKNNANLTKNNANLTKNNGIPLNNGSASNNSTTNNSSKDSNNGNNNTNEYSTNNECSSGSTHHISDVDTWGHPDRNYYIFVALSLFFGLIGADHFYLRSYDTALKKLLVNVGGLGFWYLWDVIQVLSEGAIVRKEGLSSPLDWIRGIGRGVFVPLPAEKKAAAAAKSNGANDKSNAGEKEYAAPKSYVLYTILAIVLGVFGADKFYLGYSGQGLAKLFSVFNIFLFLFGLLWVFWDAFNAFFRTEAILKDGISAPLPYSIFFKEVIVAKDLFKVQEVKEEGAEKKPEGKGTDWGALYDRFVVPLLQPSVGNGIQTANKAATLGLKGVAVANKVGSMDPQAVVGSLADATGQAALAQALAKGPEQPTVQTIQQIAEAKAQERAAIPQTGGGSGSNTSGLGPVIAGSLTALILAGGLKGIYEFLERKQG